MAEVLGTSRAGLERCVRHQMIGCAFCSSRPRFVEPQKIVRLNKVANPAAPRWEEAHLEILRTLGRYPENVYRSQVLKGVAQQTSRSYQAVYKKWMVITGQAHDRGWSTGTGVY